MAGEGSAATHTGGWTGAMARARAHAPFLARGLETLPELAELLDAGEGDKALSWARAAGAGESSIGLALRREKRALATALAIGDLAGAFDVTRVTGELSAFADRALDAAIRAAIAERVPDAEPRGFVALALGKHGAQELNYSSDIDPILLYDPVTLPRRPRDEPAEAAQRYARRVVELLSRQSAEGYVFRVDLRLRPQAEITPPAVPVAGAIAHYESSALTWERIAFIRARVAAGDHALGDQFLDAIQPFIWRSSLDFGVLEQIDRLTARIRAEHDGPPRLGPGFDLKLGRGGIREVEFLAQAQQLVHGGRHPALRLRGTRAAFEALAAAGLIDSADADALALAYEALRQAEHRVQMVQDRQTHALPEEPAALDNVARLAGHDGADRWMATLAPHVTRIAGRFEELLDDRDPPAEEMGTPCPQPLADRAARWSDGRYPALRSEAARAAFEAIRPALLSELARGPDPERAFSRFETLLSRLSSAINLFRLLEARPGLLEQLVRIVTLAPPLADSLARHPDLLDPLIDRSALDLPGSVSQLRARMLAGGTAEGYESALERIRRVVGEARFMLGVQLIEATHDPLAVAAALARVAEAAVQAGASLARAAFAERHGAVPGSELLVLGLGRLGGEALTHASDLDVVYLFTGGIGEESDGLKPLGISLYYNRLSQRVTAALSVPTAAGALYEIDTRLRPQGNQGPPAASLDAFARYQVDDAWTWEHMALTRARVVHGTDEARALVNQAVKAALARPRDTATLRGDVLAMRGEMAAHKPPRGPLDVKLLRGGLVDCEFLVHYLQLRDGTALVPQLGEALAQLAADGVVARELVAAHDMLTRILVAGRLLAPDGAMPPPAAGQALARACGAHDSDDLLQAMLMARQEVARCWAELFGETLEID